MKVENVPQLWSEKSAKTEGPERCNATGFEDRGKRPQAKECWQLLEARQDKVMGSSLESAERTLPCRHVSPGNLVLDF